MYKFTIENQEFNTFLVYQLDKDSVLDRFTYGMLSNNYILGVAPVLLSITDGIQTLRYNITGKYSLEEYLMKDVANEKMLMIFSNIAAALLEAEEYMIAGKTFVLDPKYIYIDEKTLDLFLISIPESDSKEVFDQKQMFQTLFFYFQFQGVEQAAYLPQLIHYLNYHNQFILRDFKAIIDQALQAPVDIPVNVTTSTPKEVEPQIVPESQYKSVETEYNSVINQVEQNTASNEFYEASLDEAYLVRMRNNEKIFIEKDETTIGKEMGVVDYYVDNNAAVSRCHATIIRNDHHYYILDHNSTNHTYVDGMIISSNQEKEIVNGSVITLANEEFQFVCS